MLAVVTLGTKNKLIRNQILRKIIPKNYLSFCFYYCWFYLESEGSRAKDKPPSTYHEGASQERFIRDSSKFPCVWHI